MKKIKLITCTNLASCFDNYQVICASEGDSISNKAIEHLKKFLLSNTRFSEDRIKIGIRELFREGQCNVGDYQIYVLETNCYKR